MYLRDDKDDPILNLVELEPYRYSVGIGDKVYPITSITYSANSIQLNWSPKTREEILEGWQRMVWGETDEHPDEDLS